MDFTENTFQFLKEVEYFVWYHEDDFDDVIIAGFLSYEDALNFVEDQNTTNPDKNSIYYITSREDNDSRRS